MSAYIEALRDYGLVCQFVEDNEDLCADYFFGTDEALEMGRHKARAFYEDSEAFVNWIADTAMKDKAMFARWVEFLENEAERRASA